MAEGETKADKINLDNESIWLTFAVHGVEFEIEAFDAADTLSEIDTRHLKDPHTCLNCRTEFQISADIYGQTEYYKCAACGQQYEEAGVPTGKIRLSQKFLDDVVKWLREAFGVKRMSRSEAAQFYNTVTENTSAAKKNLEQSLTSAIGSISTQPDGQNPSDAP